MAVLFCKKVSELVVGNIIREINQPMMIIQAKLSTSSHTNRVVLYYKISFIHVKTS